MDKQVKGGAPYTVEAVGAENYGTIAYVMESPHEPGVIWTTSDDGMVWLTRDNCETWQDVTPDGLEECLVNAIDVSPHDPATAYIATTRYKFNDHTPALYKTNDYGKTWKNITDGIPDGSYTRVVREDKDRRGLLYAGTEKGVYISWDDGDTWKSLQLNLPVTPITDLMVHRGDLIAATSGRSFWILDDLALLAQYSGESNEEVILYMPESPVISSGWSELNSNDPDFDGTSLNRGINPATGMVVYYQLPKLGDSTEVLLRIKDADGKVVRVISSEKDPDFKSGWAGGPPSKPTLDKNEGLNRFVWDLRHDIMPGVPEVYIEASYMGHKVPPGNYTLELVLADSTKEVTGTVLANPLYNIDDETYTEFDMFMTEMEANLTAMHELVNEMETVRKEITELADKLSEKKRHQDLVNEIQTLASKMKEWDSEMVQRKSKAYDDVENFENKFTANYLFLINQTESGIPRVNEANKIVRQQLEAEWDKLNARANRIMGVDIPALNKKLWDVGVGAIWTPPSRS